MEQDQIEELMQMPYEVIGDKALSTQDHLFKLIIIGDTGVGKSCLMKRVMDNEFKQEHQVTIGVEFGSFGLKINNQVIKLQIWDTAGQESFRSVTRIFYRGAHCVFLTYDITRDETFANLVEWLKEIQQHAAEDVKIYLIGNKSEKVEEREVQKERAIEFAKSHAIHKCFETSALTGENVEEVFSCAGKELFQQTEKDNNDTPAGNGYGEGEIKSQEKNKTKNPQTGGQKLNLPKQGGQKKKNGGCC